MSKILTSPKSYAPNQRRFDADTHFGPFEVIDVGNSQVAINLGVVVCGSSGKNIGSEKFVGGAVPQDLMKNVDETKILDVEVGDFVCILIKENDSSSPTCEIKSLTDAEIAANEQKRIKNRVVKLAKIKSITDDFLEIENLYMSQVITEMENAPPFTPIIWRDDSVTGGDGNWNAIFVPGSIYIPQTMTRPSVFHISQSSTSPDGSPAESSITMADLPVISVRAGDEYYLTFTITRDWILEDYSANFVKGPLDEETAKIEETMPKIWGKKCPSDNEEGDETSGFESCKSKDGKYNVKVLTFVAVGDNGLRAEMVWKSDILIHGWRRCNCEEETSSSSVGSDSGSGSVGSGGGSTGGSGEGSTGGSGGGSVGSGSEKSSNAIVFMPWHRKRYGALATVESSEVLFEFIYRNIPIKGRQTELTIDFRHIYLCEPGSLIVCGMPCGDKPYSVGIEINDNKLIINSSMFPWLRPNNVTFKLTGTRKGYKSWHLPSRTEEQYIQNEKSLLAMYPR